MATIPTNIGPIGARQINSNLYVGRGDLTTIQAAVNVAVKIGGIFTVYVPPEYAGSEAIDTITGSTTNVILIDDRFGPPRQYIWNGTAYFPPVILDTLGNADGSGHAVRLVTINPFETEYAGAFAVEGYSKDTSVDVIYLSCLNDSAVGVLVEVGGNLFVYENLTVDGMATVTGNLSTSAELLAASASIAGLITANDAQFATCAVANSPVRTFANTADAPAGQIWPPIGIAVSAGSTWGTSINPATLAIYPPAGIAVSTGTAWGTAINPATLAIYPPAGIPQSTGTAWGTPISAASLATWPAAGVPVSTGAAWGTPIPAADLARLSVANTFTAAQTINATLGVTGVATLSSGLMATGAGGTPPANCHHIFSSGGTNYYDSLGPNTTTAGTTIFRAVSSDSSILTSLLTLAAAGITSAVPFNVSAGTNLSLGLSVTGTGTTRASSLNVGTTGGSTFLLITGPNTTTQGAGWIGTTTSNGATNSLVIQIASGLITLNQATNVAGNFYASGTISSGGAKSFRIQHPLDETKDLIHASLEGPEAGVYYRGEGVTETGWAEIILPDYFEALTMQENRTVLLTALFEDDAEQVGMLAASRVKEGKFKVWSGLPTQKFYWEVKAVRADIAPLEIDMERGTQHKGDDANAEDD